MSRKIRKQRHERTSYNSQTPTNTNVYQLNVQKRKPIVLTPKNLNQENYICKLLDDSQTIVFATGPAGTGKTMLAVLAAIKALKDGSIEKIVVTRPAVGVDDEKHGFLPGDLNEKMAPWTRPIFDVLQEHFNAAEIAKMLEEGVVEISPLAFMRGRTFKGAFIIADEMQNATPSQMKMLLTRIGDGSRMAVTGDIAQTDRKVSENGLIDFQRLYSQFENSKYISLCSFGHQDIERHPAVAEVLHIYGDC